MAQKEMPPGNKAAGDGSFTITEHERKEIIQKERKAYANDEGVSNSWAEVKEMAFNKQNRIDYKK